MPQTPGGLHIPDHVIEQKEVARKGLVYVLAKDIFLANPKLAPAYAFQRAQAFMDKASEILDDERIVLGTVPKPDPPMPTLPDESN